MPNQQVFENVASAGGLAGVWTHCGRDNACNKIKDTGADA
jgi:hypothetical protein